LLSNAVKFSYKGEICLTAKFVRFEEHKCVVECSVKDQGMGISEEFTKKLFQPFLQADSNANRRNGGSGLGLHISKRLTELMEGEMWVESKEGEGSTFYFTVKLGLPENMRSSPAVNTKMLAHSRSLNVDYDVPILMAEDNTMNQVTVIKQHFFSLFS
jgi:signal transduction histidine kinase